MAEIVQSLFGVTPESYQQAQQQRADAQALQYAQLDPFQQAQFAIGRGANILGGAVGRALGGEDPELARISARQAISKQINYNDPTSIQQAVELLAQSGDQQGAMMLADVARKAMSEQALTQQRVAQATRERQQALPADVQTARELANLETTAAALANMEASPERDEALRRVNSQLTNLRSLTTKIEKGPSFGTDREAVAAEVYGKPFGQLTQTEKAAVNKRVEEEGGRKAAAGAAKLVMPGEKALVDIPGFRATVQKTIEPQAKAVFAADNALTNIQDSIDTGNFASYRAAQVQFAKAIAGAGDLSQKELKAAGADPALLGGTADYLSTLFSSTPTLDTQNKMKRTLQAIKKVSTDKANAEIDNQRKIALRNKGYDPESVNAALNFPEFQAAPAGGGTLAEQAAAILKARQTAQPGVR